MGFDKALLPFGTGTLIERMVERLSPAVESLVIVSRHDLALPKLPDGIQILFDERPAFGPLEGLRVGLQWIDQQIRAGGITGEAPQVFATGCDAPLLKPSLVDRMFDLGQAYTIAVAADGKFRHPLAAVYRSTVASSIVELQARDEHRPRTLFEKESTRVVDVANLRDVDPDLDSFCNLNCPADYFEMLSRLNLSCPNEVRRQLESRTESNDGK